MLASDDYLQVLACIEELHRCRTLTDFPQQALAAFARLLRSNFSAFNEVNLPRGRILAVTSRPLENHAEMAALWERYSGQHPLVRYVTETGDGQAVKISDFLSTREYHRLDLYRNFYAALTAEDQMSITIRSDRGFLIALAFNRARRNFTEMERVKLNLVRPHLLQAYANLEEMAGHQEEKADLQTALRETGHGLLALDPAGGPAHATPGAWACLARYFPQSGSTLRLPEPLAEWLRSEPVAPFTAEAAGFRLIVRHPRHAPRPLLLLSEEQKQPPLPRLTEREREVLGWLAEAKTNPEIALILGVATGTVKMHVERVLAKLGVENRTAASALARAAGLVC